MKKLLLLLLLVSGNAWAQETPKMGVHNYKGTNFYGYCIDGVEYLINTFGLDNTSSRIGFTRLKPDGKPVLCNY